MIIKGYEENAADFIFINACEPWERQAMKRITTLSMVILFAMFMANAGLAVEYKAGDCVWQQSEYGSVRDSKIYRWYGTVKYTPDPRSSNIVVEITRIILGNGPVYPNWSGVDQRCGPVPEGKWFGNRICVGETFTMKLPFPECP